jgi:hypothetical protein
MTISNSFRLKSNIQSWRLNLALPVAIVGLLLPLEILSRPRAAGSPGVYKGELQLPVDLYTSEGVSLEAAKWEIEVRQENARCEFIFRKKEKIVARIGGETLAEEQLKQIAFGMPLAGTVRLEEAAAKEAGTAVSSDPSSYLMRMSWRLTLRILGPPNGNEVFLVFAKNDASDQPLKVIFRLFRSKPK